MGGTSRACTRHVYACSTCRAPTVLALQRGREIIDSGWSGNPPYSSQFSLISATPHHHHINLALYALLISFFKGSEEGETESKRKRGGSEVKSIFYFE